LCNNPLFYIVAIIIFSNYLSVLIQIWKLNQWFETATCYFQTMVSFSLFTLKYN
jgi:hypothetical protein